MGRLLDRLAAAVFTRTSVIDDRQMAEIVLRVLPDIERDWTWRLRAGLVEAGVPVALAETFEVVVRSREAVAPERGSDQERPERAPVTSDGTAGSTLRA